MLEAGDANHPRAPDHTSGLRSVSENQIFRTCQCLIDLRVRVYNFGTVNPLYNGILYNSKIRYNVNPICKKKSAARVFFFIDSSMLFFRKTYVLDIEAEAILTNTQNV